MFPSQESFGFFKWLSIFTRACWSHTCVQDSLTFTKLMKWLLVPFLHLVIWWLFSIPITAFVWYRLFLCPARILENSRKTRYEFLTMREKLKMNFTEEEIKQILCNITFKEWRDKIALQDCCRLLVLIFSSFDSKVE